MSSQGQGHLKVKCHLKVKVKIKVKFISRSNVISRSSFPSATLMSTGVSWTDRCSMMPHNRCYRSEQYLFHSINSRVKIFSRSRSSQSQGHFKVIFNFIKRSGLYCDVQRSLLDRAPFYCCMFDFMYV